MMERRLELPPKVRPQAPEEAKDESKMYSTENTETTEDSNSAMLRKLKSDRGADPPNCLT